MRSEIDNIQGLLEHYGDIKWIYQSLSECTLALEWLEPPANGEGSGGVGDSGDAASCLAKLRELGTLRSRRWAELREGAKGPSNIGGG